MNTLEKYNEIKTKHSEFNGIEISNANLYKDKVLVAEWNTYARITLIVTICLMMATASSLLYYEYINNSDIHGLFHQFSKKILYGQKWLRYTLYFGCIALFTYTCYLPFMININSKIYSILFSKNINSKIYSNIKSYLFELIPLSPNIEYLGDKKGYVRYTIISLYLIVFTFFLMYYHLLPFDANILIVAFLCLTIIPLFFVVFFGSSYVFSQFIRNIGPHVNSYRLISYLIDAIYLIDNLNYNKNISVSNKDELIGLIKKASRNLYALESYFNSKLGEEQIEYSIKSLNGYLIWIYSPENSALETLSNELCIYLKAAITGNYHYFPTKSKTEKKYHVNNKKYRIYFGISLAFPIIVVLLIRNFFGYTFDSNIMNMLYALYGIWVFISWNLFSFNIGEDTFETIKDLLKIIIKK